MRRWPLIAVLCLGASGLWALEGEADVQVIQNHVAAVQGPPGTPVSEAEVDETLAQGTLTHRQGLAPGLSAEGTFWASLDTLPSQTSQSLPQNKLAFSSHFLEGWLSWEPLPGTLNFGGGKQVIHPSSGFSHTPLDFAVRSAPTTGAQATSSWEEGWIGTKVSGFLDKVSASVFYAPSLSWNRATDDAGLKYLTSQQTDGFVQGQIGLTLDATDLRALVFQGPGNPRLGLGVDSSWGDALTLRAESAADASQAAPRFDSMAGATWTTTEQSTVMAELSRDETGTTGRTYGFVRAAGKLDSNVDADAWAKTNLDDHSGWLGSSVTYTADHWALGGSWLGSWGSPTSDAGLSPLRWKTTVEVKAFF